MNATSQSTPTAAPRLGDFGEWVRAHLFNSRLNSVITIVLAVVLAMVLPRIIDWAVLSAVWQPDPAVCQKAKGACWGFIAEKHRVMLFGTYPYEEQWRPLATMVLLIGLIVVTLRAGFWGRWLWLSWLAGIVAMSVLMFGGVLGLPYVATEKWGGLPVTLILSVNAIVFSVPIGILLALGRTSDLPAIKALSVGFIELVRGVPLITILFMASLMIPLFLPEGITINKLLRAQVGIILFAGAYTAEVVRAGLQAIPRGQYEAADALGLGYWEKMSLIILPQALRIVIPPMVNNFISIFKDTSLIIVIGLFDFLGAVRLAGTDPDWRSYYVEGLVAAALVYFAFCYAMAAYSQRLEKRLAAGG
ncbi:MAG: hypothetical protein RLZ98_2723 [Pseudomonadota bacterium]